jgi:RNA recognition motif. (a.k.a. RRM, RBD, or RNP domain)
MLNLLPVAFSLFSTSYPATLSSYSDMEAKLMLVEMRLRFSGKLAGQTEKKQPAKFSSKFEEAMWTKPAFKTFYDKLKANGDHNAQNVVAEYLNDKKMATQRYGKTYKGILREAETALTAPPPVTSPTLKFSGFPANMGESACRMTLESIGPIAEFSCVADDDFPILKGKVTFEDIESAKKAVAQYNGMNMGMGTALEMVSA